MQVGTVPDDWQCYRRAEVIPIGIDGNCTVASRDTLLADSTNGAADAASEAAAALATAAVLLGPNDTVFAKQALDTAHALHDYATLYPVCHNSCPPSFPVTISTFSWLCSSAHS